MGNSPIPFLEGQLLFTTIADGSITFAFTDTGSASVALDNVSIAAVPEASPVFSMLLLSAVMASGYFLRFRRRV